MDEKEQADRMAAAEALFMISTNSTRVDKSRTILKTSKRGRKKKPILDEIVEEKKKSDDFGQLNISRRGRGRRGGGGQRGTNGKRGRGGKNNPSPRGRGGSGARRGRKNSERSFGKSEDVGLDYDNQTDFNDSMAVSYFETIVTQENSKKKNKTKPSKLRDQRKSSQYSNSSSKSPMGAGVQEEEEVSHQAIGFTGATISIPENPSRRVSFETSQNIIGPVSTLKQQQYNLNSKSFGVPVSLASLPPMNLLSFPSDSIANLPSIPLELESLRLSSQPTPNLSSLGDQNTEGVMDFDDNTCDDRDKSEKFLPLKKRKLHNATPTSNMVVKIPTTTMEASQDSDQDDTYEPMSPEAEKSSRPTTPPTRFTVQAPPIITMQTLVEINTALTPDEDGDLPLHIAVVHENMRMVIKLINLMKIAGRGVDKFNKQQQTPLHLAVKLDFLDAVDFLLKSGANVNAVDCTGSSAIHMAVQGRSIKCLQMLLDRCPEAEINARNFDGLTPLHTAVDNGDLELVELLLKYSAEIDVTDGKSGRTCLFRAAENNEKAMVELLLRNGANPEVPNYAGVTPAMAVQGRNLHGVLKLLGSASTDKCPEGESKAFGAENPAFPGQQSEPATPRESGPYRHSPERKEKPDTPNETKVFQNVFVVSQKTDAEMKEDRKSTREKCWSEPSSPGVKMEVQEESEQDVPREQGLLSLPEGIFRPRTGNRQTEVTHGSSEHRLAGPRDRKVDLISAAQAPSRQSSVTGQLPVAGGPNSATAKSISDTSMLTSNQARLYQKLLEMYGIETTGPSAVSSSLPAVPVPSISQTYSSNARSFTLSLPRSQPAVKHSPADGPSPFVRNPGQSPSNTTTQRVEHNGHSGTTMRIVSQPIKTEVVIAASPPDTPLNLSRPVLNQSKPDGGAASLNATVLQNLPIHRETVIGIRRVSGQEKSGDLPGSPGEQYVLLPVSDQQVTSQSRVFNISTLRLAREPSRASASPPAPNQVREGEATTKLVSQKTASLVRDFLNKQQRSSSPLASSTTVLPQTSNSTSLVIPLTTSSVRVSAPKSQTVVVSSGQVRQVMSLSRPAVPADRTYTEGLGVVVPKPTSDTLPTTHPVIKHEAKVIDFSSATAAKVAVPQHNLRTFLNAPVLLSRNNTDANQIVGFSGAILSVVPSKQDRQEQYVAEKVEVKVKESLPKEQQKKRGRKPGKTPQDAVMPSETSLGKINSDTDEKLRQFLGAKKSDVLPSVLEDLEKKSNSESSSRPPVDTTYRTVGIFSGDVQHVRIGKTYSPSSLSSSSAPNAKSMI